MSHIQNIEIKNFKSISNARIEDCRRVNVFIGYPNVGKSNILEAIGLYSLTQANKGELISLKSVCRLRTLSDVFFNKDIKNNPTVIINKLFEAQVRRPDIREDILTEGLSKDPYKEPKKEWECGFFSPHISSGRLPYLRVSGLLNGTHTGLSYDSNVQSNDWISERIKYYNFNADSVVDQRKGTSLSIPNGDNLHNLVDEKSELRKELIKLYEPYGLSLSITGNKISVAKILEDKTFVSFEYHMIADTMRRLFFHKVAIATNSNTVLLFEEPEAHMFPPYISKFTSDVTNDENSNQFFITTHSPFVLNDFMDDLKTDELAIYIVSYKKETGETIIHRMNDEEIHEAKQFGYDFFMNMNNFIPAK